MSREHLPPLCPIYSREIRGEKLNVVQPMPCNQMRGVSLVGLFFPAQDTQSRGKGSAAQTHSHEKLGFRTRHQVCIWADMHLPFTQRRLTSTDGTFSTFRLAKRTPGEGGGGGRAGEEVTESVSPRGNTAAASDDVHAHAVRWFEWRRAPGAADNCAGHFSDRSVSCCPATIFNVIFSL